MISISNPKNEVKIMFGISKSTAMTVLTTLAVIAVINNVSQLSALKETLNGDKGWF